MDVYPFDIEVYELPGEEVELDLLDVWVWGVYYYFLLGFWVEWFADPEKSVDIFWFLL